MKSRVLYTIVLVCCGAYPVAAQTFTVTAPAGATPIAVKSAEDFPTRAFQDPWDMSQRTDVGWWTFGTDTAAAANFTNPTVANGVFTGTMNGSVTAALFLLESGLAPPAGGAATPAGKTGQQYPINASLYKHLVYRMSSDVGGVSQYVWSQNTIYDGQSVAAETAQNQTIVQPGWKIYDIDMTKLTVLAGPNVPWAGTLRSLQILPNAASKTATIQIDWIRLVDDQPALKQNVTWTGGTADIYLDTDNDPTNGTLGRIAVNATSPYNFYVGALPAGQYFIAVHAHTPGEVVGSSATASQFSYSTGSYQVNDMPTITFTTPSEEGSSDDFATTKLGDPWDFLQKSDVDSSCPCFPGKQNVVNDGITQIPLTTEAGVNLGLQTVYLGTSVAAGPGAAAPQDPVGDPQVFTLFWDGKGKANKIDVTKYRIATIEAGIPNKARSLPGGSIGRLVWRAANETVTDGNGTKLETSGEHYELNSAVGENTVSKISVDMNKWPVEPASPDPTTSWTSSQAVSGGMDGFRFDPHEFPAATNFFIRRIKLAALERTQSDQFTVKWNASKAGTVTVFYDQDANHTFTLGTVACGPVSVSAGAGSCTWNVPAALAAGEYQVYAKIDDGINQNFEYALTNVIVDHQDTTAAVNLNRTTLYYSQLGGVHTDPQVVRVTTSGPGSTPCWTATPSATGVLSVSPASACGPANISIAVTGFFPAGVTTTIFVRVAPMSGMPGDWSPRNIAVNVTGLTSSTAPIGAFDTPADGTTVTGSVAVTGWAVDDVGVTSVAICRDPVGSELATPGPCAGQNQVFIGNATFVDDARPDIVATFPTSPLDYRAGWGYLLLSNFLPNQGNGPVRLSAYAFDSDGHVSLLGSKTINTDNIHATKPFGSIDRPMQGEVVCGTFTNAGWALTQMPKDVPADSSTITLFIDNVAVKHLDPGRIARSDVTGLFAPTYDTSHAAGGTNIDTTQYTNGVHTIFWIVEDTGLQSDGVGSRFFTISNPCPGG